MICDVTKESDVRDAIAKTVAYFGTIHVALAGAGISQLGMTLTSKSSLDMNIFEKTIKINLLGSVYVAKHAAIAMAKNKALND